MKPKLYLSPIYCDVTPETIKSYLVFFYDPKTSTSFTRTYKNESTLNRACRNYWYCHRTVIPEWRNKSFVEDNIKPYKRRIKQDLPF